MVKITETVLRDGHQSLIATRMGTEDMLPILGKLDKVGFFSLEMWGGATFDVSLRYLKEDPWHRLREIRKLIKNTKLQMLLRGQNLVGYRHYPDDIVVKFVQKAKDNGIDVFRIFDALNDIRNLEIAIKAAKKAGAIVEGAISYTISPVHTIEKYLKFGFELKDSGADIICIKDMSGIISPVPAYDLINVLKKEVKLPVHLHTHCSSGMAPIACLTACEAGVDYLDTAISPFGWGTSQPPTESIVGALRGTPFDTGLDLNLLIEIAEYFQKVKDKYRQFLDPIAERIDSRILVHQTPGGMISNLISQLKEQNALDKYDEVLKETARVRKELGYPPLVTPTSQIVGTQAVFNVILGERYKMISKEVMDYIKGLYGRAPAEIDEEVRKKAIGDEQPITTRPATLLSPEWEKSLQETKKQLDSQTPSEEDVLSYALFPLITKEFWESKKTAKVLLR
jgi:pyruvate carboxylase subunit B